MLLYQLSYSPVREAGFEPATSRLIVEVTRPGASAIVF